VEPRIERRRHSLAFALALAVSSSLAACSLDFHRFVPPDGDAAAPDAQLEALAIDATAAPNTQIASARAAFVGGLTRVAASSLRVRAHTNALPANRRPRAS